MKTETISQSLEHLSKIERAELDKLAANVGMTTPEYVEFANKSQIYRNAEERLGMKGGK